MDAEQVFNVKIWPLNSISKKGSSMRMAEHKFITACHQERLDPEFLYKKYFEYIKSIQRKNRLRDEKYHTTPETIEDWIDGSKWTDSPMDAQLKTPKDQYFYGETNEESPTV